MLITRCYRASELGAGQPGGAQLDGADMKAAALTEYTTGVLPAPSSFIFNPVIDIVNVGGGAAGSAKLILESLDPDGSVIKTLDIVTAIPTNTADVTVQCDLIFGAGVTPALYGVGVINDDAPKFKILFSFRLTLHIVAANNGTSSFASMSLEQEG